MSLINQVLNQLERRGAHASLKQRMVRPVPRVQPSVVPLLLLAGGLLLAGMALWAQLSRIDPAGKVQSPVVTAPAVPVPVVTAPVVVDGSAVWGEAEGMSPVSGVAVSGASASGVLMSGEELVATLYSKITPLDVEPSVPVTPPARAKAAEPPKPPKPAPQRNRQAVDPPPAVPTVPADSQSLKRVSPAQLAEVEFRRGSALLQQGRSGEAIDHYQEALRLDAAHDGARQALVVLLLETKRSADAERMLLERLGDRPEHAGFAMLLARLQVERGAVGEALPTLERTLPFATGRADYRAFYAALLQRAGRHQEAAAHFQAALQSQPNHGAWAMGHGISLKALQRSEEAKAAFRQALDSKTLSHELQAYVQQQLKALDAR